MINWFIYSLIFKHHFIDFIHLLIHEFIHASQIHLFIYSSDHDNLFIDSWSDHSLTRLSLSKEPVSIIEQPCSTAVSSGGRVELNCRARGFPSPQYQWLKNGEEIPHGCDSTLVISNAKATDHGKYSCIVSNDLNAEKSNCVEVQVQDKVVGMLI